MDSLRDASLTLNASLRDSRTRGRRWKEKRKETKSGRWRRKMKKWRRKIISERRN
jgi:hypothetical protein